MLAVVPTENVTDERIASDVVEALERNGNVMAERVTVEVKDGLVTLTGMVHDRSAYLAAEDAARGTYGVLGVINDLEHF
jgi:osmotically-inducible protein OsmY